MWSSSVDVESGEANMSSRSGLYRGENAELRLRKDQTARAWSISAASLILRADISRGGESGGESGRVGRELLKMFDADYIAEVL